ncbi:MAG: hypothetical protein [Inoviridae sp.]|nr:MAG: hypothetical protein [Inoviridae sp.]
MVNKMTNLRISQESSKLIQSLDEHARYIKFIPLGDSYSAVICSQITDEYLSTVLSGNAQIWLFSDIEKAIRSIRRLHKNISIYTGVFHAEN